MSPPCPATPTRAPAPRSSSSRRSTRWPPTAGSTRACSSRSSSPRTAGRTPSCRSRSSRRRCSAPSRSTTHWPRWRSGSSTPTTSCRGRPASTCSPGGCPGCAVTHRCRGWGSGRPVTSTPSRPPCSPPTTPTSPCRARPAPARPTSPPGSSPASCSTTAGRSASRRRVTRRSRTSCAPSSRPGCRAEQVGKATRDPEGATWTTLAKADDLAEFAAGHARAGQGYVVGGTAWDLTSTRRVGRGQLDLVVVDEAGQFSLAKTLACSVAGARLLLLGDPQQLPQVSQGTHPDPVDASALGWLIGDEPVLSPDLGYFLETTWRMHPALTAPISRLSYAGQLRSETSVTARAAARRRRAGAARAPRRPPRQLDVVPRGGRGRPRPRARPARSHLARPRRSAGPTARRSVRARCGPTDVIVITPYNGQVGQLRRTLDDAGLADVPVGTVDKFQGQEAAVAILSMAASSHSDVSRGMGFLLDRHRLNVAISRGQHCAYVVRSTVLTDFAPRTPGELIDLGAFLGLCARRSARHRSVSPSRCPPEPRVRRASARSDARGEVRAVPEPLEPAHQLVVHRVGPAQPAAVVERGPRRSTTPPGARSAAGSASRRARRGSRRAPRRPPPRRARGRTSELT